MLFSSRCFADVADVLGSEDLYTGQATIPDRAVKKLEWQSRAVAIEAKLLL